jgi:hypothetical protein
MGFGLASCRGLSCEQVEVSLPYWVVVDELSADLPRKDPDLPNVRVRVVRCEATDTSQLEYFTALFAGAGSSPIKLRPGPFGRRVDAVKQRRKISSVLSGLGFTINRDTNVRGVYVIELDQSHAPVPSQPWVYVGETSKRFETRFEEHKTGKRTRSGRGRLFSKVVKAYGIRLREDLYPPLPNRYYSLSASEAAERFWIYHLKSRGFQVEGGHEEHGQTRRRLS